MKLNKQQTTFFIGFILLTIFLWMTIFNNSHTINTTEILVNKPWEKEIHIDNHEYLQHYIYSLTGFYHDLPWAIRTSYTIIQISGLALIILLYILFWDVRNRKEKQAIYETLKSIYLYKFKQIATSNRELEKEEVRNILLPNEIPEFSYTQKLSLIDLFLEVRMQIPIQENSFYNIQTALEVMGLQHFMEERLLSSRDNEKLKIIQAIRLLHLNVTDSYVNRILNHRDPDLQKAARLYYILSNEEDPFHYLEGKNQTGSFLPWDMLETHQIFEDCQKLQKELPSFIPALTQMENSAIMEFFIQETAYWGSEQEMNYISRFLDSEKENLRKAALISINLRKMTQSEKKLKDIYYEQPESIKRIILYTLLIIAPFSSLDFFREAFENTSSQLTKRMALQCLWKSEKEGQYIFSLLKEKALPNEKILFLHVENPIIGREKLNLYSIH